MKVEKARTNEKKCNDVRMMYLQVQRWKGVDHRQIANVSNISKHMFMSKKRSIFGWVEGIADYVNNAQHARNV